MFEQIENFLNSELFSYILIGGLPCILLICEIISHIIYVFYKIKNIKNPDSLSYQDYFHPYGDQYHEG